MRVLVTGVKGQLGYDVKTKKLQLLLAMEAYDWNVKGLTTSN